MTVTVMVPLEETLTLEPRVCGGFSGPRGRVGSESETQPGAEGGAGLPGGEGADEAEPSARGGGGTGAEWNERPPLRPASWRRRLPAARSLALSLHRRGLGRQRPRQLALWAPSSPLRQAGRIPGAGGQAAPRAAPANGARLPPTPQHSEGDAPTLTEVDLFISTQRIKVLNADTQVSGRHRVPGQGGGETVPGGRARPSRELGSGCRRVRERSGCGGTGSRCWGRGGGRSWGGKGSEDVRCWPGCRGAAGGTGGDVDGRREGPRL